MQSINAEFDFVDKSEINANRKDASDYPEGVWMLPSALKLKVKDRKEYQLSVKATGW